MARTDRIVATHAGSLVIMWAKLGALAEGAALASKREYG
jgi:hypothetical protein